MQRMTRIDKNDISRQYNDKFIMYSDRACGIILSSLTASRRQYQNKPRPSDLFPLSLPNTIKFIPSGAKTQKKEIIPYPRCGFGACIRCGRASYTQRLQSRWDMVLFLFSSVFLLNESNSNCMSILIPLSQ